MSQFCSNCRFWEKPDEAWATYGLCRRNAPKTGTDQPNPFPHTKEDDWCGEYEHGTPRKAA